MHVCISIGIIFCLSACGSGSRMSCVYLHAFVFVACAPGARARASVRVCVCSYGGVVVAPGKCQGLKWRFDKGMGTGTWQEGERAYTLRLREGGSVQWKDWREQNVDPWQILKVYWGILMSRHSLLPSSPLTTPTPSVPSAFRCITHKVSSFITPLSSLSGSCLSFSAN